jgi:hypothetical protein
MAYFKPIRRCLYYYLAEEKVGGKGRKRKEKGEVRERSSILIF